MCSVVQKQPCRTFVVTMPTLTGGPLFPVLPGFPAIPGIPGEPGGPWEEKREDSVRDWTCFTGVTWHLTIGPGGPLGPIGPSFPWGPWKHKKPESLLTPKTNGHKRGLWWTHPHSGWSDWADGTGGPRWALQTQHSSASPLLPHLLHLLFYWSLMLC